VIIFAYVILKCLFGKTFRTILRIFYQYRPRFHLLTEVLDLPIQFHGDLYLHYQAIEISQTLNLPATYDAHYLVLAQRFQANLYTSDKRLFNSVKSSLSWVHLVEV